jgi:DNA repair exonuclease SbcCD nuclease subunit
MSKLIHAADIHLSIDEKEYSLAVLEEITNICNHKNADMLLLAGDVFDSWSDIEPMRASFRNTLEKLPSATKVYYIPGNHEELRVKAGGSLVSFDFGRAKLLSEKPFSLVDIGEAELLALPFQRDYSHYREWQVPQKKKAHRIILAHGTVPGIAYIGLNEEDLDGILDLDLFSTFEADLALMGHLHGETITKKDKTTIAYPGSSRVWREGETGPRQVLLFNITEQGISPPEQIPIKTAGEYRIIPIYADPDGNLKPITRTQGTQADWLSLEVSGVVEDESEVIKTIEKLKSEWQKKYRKITVNTEKLSVLSGISIHPLAIQFLKKWQEEEGQYKDADQEAYILARFRGLEAIKKIQEGRK